MTSHHLKSKTQRSRSLRVDQTRSEGLLWSILRAKQLCGLKFRRQHPIGPWFADFACPEKLLVVEIDGGYHDQVIEKDLQRQHHLESHGWTVVRFTDEEVQDDAEAVGRAIAKQLKIPCEFRRRRKTGAGSRSVRAAKSTVPRPSPRLGSTLPSLGLDPPRGRVK